MPRPRRALIVHEGSLGDRCHRLLTLSGIDSDVVPIGGDVRIAAYGAVALLGERPYFAIAEELDRLCWESGVPWTSAIQLAHEFRVGPTIYPGRTPCFQCWRRRVRSMTQDLAVHDAMEALGRLSPYGPWLRGVLEPALEQTAAIVAAEIVSAIASESTVAEPGVGRYLEGDVFSYPLRPHAFVFCGYCTRCGTSRPDATWLGLSQYFSGPS